MSYRATPYRDVVPIVATSVLGYENVKMSSEVEHRSIVAKDGLRLHARLHGSAYCDRLPVVCLPGLTRSARDFDVLARRLASTRCVICPDYRGRGLSEFDPDWRRYNMDVEGDDICGVLATLGISRAIFIGTSRGGLHAMRLAKVAPSLVAAAVLNDIGPVLENDGLRRIRGYVGAGNPPSTLAESVAAVMKAADGRFPALAAEDWVAYANMTYGDDDGSFHRRYDPQLARTLDGLDLTAPQPTLWPLFQALAERPLLTIRGELSDLLAPTTFAQMARHGRTHVVPGQGHAPLLIDAPTGDVVVRFVEQVVDR